MGWQNRRLSFEESVLTTHDNDHKRFKRQGCMLSLKRTLPKMIMSILNWLEGKCQSTQGFLPRAAHRPRCVQDSDHRPKLSKVRNSPSSLNLSLKAWLWLQPRDEAPDLKIDLEILCHHLDGASGGKEACHSLGRSCRATQNTMNWPLVRPLSSR